ncbi:MAG: DUF5666 domain-containing protein [Gammaproteobacteria bacterium]
MSTHEITAKVFKALAITGLVGMLIACGGGGGSLTSVSVVTKGVITGLGSIWVNGVEYETPDGGSYSNDDSTSTIASYEIGQVVSLRGRRHGDGVSGTATEVEYEAEIEGAASGGAINGVTILITPTTNVTKATLDINDDLIDGSRYEVSGFWLDNTTIEATFIKDDDDSGSGGDGIDEVKGFVEAPNLDPLALTVRGVTYTYIGTPAVSVGDLVEIHFDPLNNIASRVELEDDFFDNQGHGQEVELEGAVNMDPTDLAGCPADADFLIDRTCIDWDSVPSDGWMDGLTGEADMESGLRVEAEGHFNATGDLLIAEKIKGRGNRVRITAVASNVGTGGFDVFGGTIQVTTQSGLTDSNGASIVNGAGLEIRGIRTGPTSVLAIRIKDDSVNSTSIHVLRAKVDENGADSGAQTITVMGVTSDADGSTQLEIEDVPFTSGIVSFLTSIDDDNIVNSTNGPRDVVDVRIDPTKAGSIYYAKQIEIEREDD